MKTEKPDKQKTMQSNPDSSCQTPLTEAQQKVRKGRKSLVTVSRGNAKNRLRYIEGTTELKEGCWLSSE